jgi:uncharacterized membrane protein
MKISGRIAWGLLAGSIVLNVFFAGVIASRFLPFMIGPPPRPPVIDSIYKAADELDEPARTNVIAAWEHQDRALRARFDGLQESSLNVLAQLATRDLDDAEILNLIQHEGQPTLDLPVALLIGVRDAARTLSPVQRLKFVEHVREGFLHHIPPPPFRR